MVIILLLFNIKQYLIMAGSEESQSFNAYFTMWNSDHLDNLHYPISRSSLGNFGIFIQPNQQVCFHPDTSNRQKPNIHSIDHIGSKLYSQTTHKTQKSINSIFGNIEDQNVSVLIKKRWKQSKNKNVLKFLLKLLRNQSPKRKSKLQKQYHELFDLMITYLLDLFAWNRQDPKKHNINTDHLRQIFSLQLSQNPFSCLILRIGIDAILQRSLRASIIRNSKCQNKFTYLNALKVYKLRCRNQKMAQRMQT